MKNPAQKIPDFKIPVIGPPDEPMSREDLEHRKRFVNLGANGKNIMMMRKIMTQARAWVHCSRADCRRAQYCAAPKADCVFRNHLWVSTHIRPLLAQLAAHMNAASPGTTDKAGGTPPAKKTS